MSDWCEGCMGVGTVPKRGGKWFWLWWSLCQRFGAKWPQRTCSECDGTGRWWPKAEQQKRTEPPDPPSPPPSTTVGGVPWRFAQAPHIYKQQAQGWRDCEHRLDALERAVHAAEQQASQRLRHVVAFVRLGGNPSCDMAFDNLRRLVAELRACAARNRPDYIVARDVTGE